MSTKYNFLTDQVDHIASHFEKPLSDEEKSSMNTLREITAKIDSLLDSLVMDESELQTQENNILQHIQNGNLTNLPLTTQESDLLSNIISHPKKGEKFYQAVKNIFYCQKHMRAAKDLVEYIKRRYKEGAYSADLCLLATDLNDKNIERYGREFMGYINLADSAIDLSEDYNNREIAFRPHALMQLKLAIIAYKKSARSMRSIANKTQSNIGQVFDTISMTGRIPYTKKEITIKAPSVKYSFAPNKK